MKNLAAPATPLPENGDLKTLTAWYNENSGTKPRKFKDLETAQKECAILKEACDGLSGQSSKPAKKEGKKKEAAPKSGKAAPAPKEKASKAKDSTATNGESKGTKGRTSKFKGKLIKRSTEGNANPRREGSHGWKAFELIDPKKGIRYEDYMKSGGAANHLNWDLDHGFVVIED